MKELFLSECRRFRTAALIAAGAHLLLLLLASRMTEPLLLRWREQLLFPILYFVGAFAFAAYQFGTYRQPSRWVWLLHRPLPRGRIFAALALAALVLVAAAIGLPVLLAMAGTDQLTGRTVDARHYLGVIYLVLVALTGWLAGTYLMLCGRRSAWVVLVVPALLMAHLAPTAQLLAPALACVALFTALAYSAFKPDRSAPPATLAGLLSAALPLQLGFYFVLLWGGSLVFQYGQMLVGEHPLNRPQPPGGGYTELARADGRTAIARGLAAATDPRAAHWRRQVALTDVGAVSPALDAHPRRHDASNLETLQWADPERGIIWSFSHDRMLFEGRDTYTDAPRGWYGVGGMGDRRPFASVPVLADKTILTRQALLVHDKESGRAHPLIQLAGQEVLSGPAAPVGMLQFALTNQRLIAYRQPVDPLAPLEQLYSVDLPGPFSDLHRVDIARLLDGTLLSFNYGRRMSNGMTGSAQHLVFVDASGRAQALATRPLAHDFHALFEHKAWWLSPLTQAVLALPERLLGTGTIPDAPGPQAPGRPATVLGAALLAALLSAACAWWLGSGQGRGRRLAWTAAALVLGPACLACQWVLQPRRPRMVTAEAPRAFAAAAA